MADIAELVKVMQEQMQLQQEQIQLQREQMQKQDEQHKQQLVIMQQQMEDTRKVGGTMAPQHQTPPFPAFDSTAELSSAMEGLPVTLRDVCERKLCT